MLRLEDVDMFAGGKLLFRDISLQVVPGDRIGIIGRNGAGKSHLLEVLGGHVIPDAGTRHVSNNVKVLLVKQELPDETKSPIEFLRDNDPDLQALNEKLDTTDMGDDNYALLSEQLADLDTERYDLLAPKILRGLGLSLEQIEKPFGQLSGGLRMRVSIAAALIQQPDILLLDEPTNHLDLEAAQWLISYLKAYPHAYVIVSHDVALLNSLAKTTFHLKKNNLIQYSGNYDQFLIETKKKEEKDVQRNKDLEKQAQQAEQIYYKFRGIPSRSAQAVQRLNRSESLREQKVEIIPEEPIIPLKFDVVGDLHSPILSLENVSVAYGDKVILKGLNLSINYGAKIALVGRNGEGKSTLIKLITDNLEPKTGHKLTNPKLKVGYFSQDLRDQLEENLTVYQQFSKLTEISNDEQLRSLLGTYGFPREKVDVKVGVLSGGELSRLCLGIICARSPNFIILDEPTNHLDVETRDVLVAAIQNYKGTVLLVSHDADLHEKTMDECWLVEGGLVKPYPKGIQAYKQSLDLAMRNPTQSQKSSSAKTDFFKNKKSKDTDEGPPVKNNNRKTTLSKTHS